MSNIKEGYIRVTDLLKPWREIRPELDEIIAAKAVIGTNVHEAITSHMLGLPMKELSERELQYLECYRKWEGESKVELLKSEERLYDEEIMITGEVDCLLDLNGPCIVDFKTSVMADMKGWAIQMGWYYMLCVHNKIPVKEIAYILQLNDKGKDAKLHRIEITEDLKDDCLSLYKSYIYMKGFPCIKKA